MNCSDRKNKLKDSISKLLFYKSKEIVILFRLLQLKLSIFIPEIKLNSEIILLQNFKNRILKLKPN